MYLKTTPARPARAEKRKGRSPAHWACVANRPGGRPPGPVGGPEAHPEYADGVEAKKKRHQETPPTLEEFVRSAYEHHSKKGHMTFAQFWDAFDHELHLTTWLKQDEKKMLAETLDSDHDGEVSFDEFLAAIVPLMKHAFNSRGGAEW